MDLAHMIIDKVGIVTVYIKQNDGTVKELLSWNMEENDNNQLIEEERELK